MFTPWNSDMKRCIESFFPWWSVVLSAFVKKLDHFGIVNNTSFPVFISDDRWIFLHEISDTSPPKSFEIFKRFYAIEVLSNSSRVISSCKKKWSKCKTVTFIRSEFQYLCQRHFEVRLLFKTCSLFHFSSRMNSKALVTCLYIVGSVQSQIIDFRYEFVKLHRFFFRCPVNVFQYRVEMGNHNSLFAIYVSQWRYVIGVSSMILNISRAIRFF